MPIPSGESHPLAISADGITVAGYRAVGTPFVWIAFRWTAQEGMQDLGLLPGAYQSLAESISADGTAIAGSCCSLMIRCGGRTVSPSTNPKHAGKQAWGVE